MGSPTSSPIVQEKDSRNLKHQKGLRTQKQSQTLKKTACLIKTINHNRSNSSLKYIDTKPRSLVSMETGPVLLLCPHCEPGILLLSRTCTVTRWNPQAGSQHYLLLLHFVPAAPAALSFLHPEHMSVAVLPASINKQVSGSGGLCSGHQLRAATASTHSSSPEGRLAGLFKTVVGQLNIATVPGV